MSAGTILLIGVVLVILYLISLYNRLVALRQSTEAAWSDIDVQLKRRYNLIPALVDVIKGYKAYEGSVLERIVKARQMGLNAKSVKEHEEADSIIRRSLGQIFAIAEAYPDLKADKTFINLQNELSRIEEVISDARRYYNAVVRDYNTALETFPSVIIAQKFNFKPKEFFELDEKEAQEVKKMPKIDLES